MKLNVLSGKGGVGKSSITASLAVLLSREHRVVAVDCDVDASNLALVLGVREISSKKKLSLSEKARLAPNKCTGCGKCVEACAFGAIKMESGKPVINSALCEGCGSCALACPLDAIELYPIEDATIGSANTKYGFPVVSAQLEMGEAGSGKVVYEVKKLAAAFPADITIIDSAAGIGCPVVASVQGSDYVIAVTEPTPAALWDLKRALKVVSHFNIPAGIVINKADLNPEQAEAIRRFASKNGLRILAEIPYDKAFVEALVRMEPPVAYKPELEPIFKKIADAALLGSG